MELSFGEQIKILLKRKNMTIQNLADLYTEKTGTRMSRQNLTQRLNRDNFPEQDMHLLASLLGYSVSLQLVPAAGEAIAAVPASYSAPADTQATRKAAPKEVPKTQIPVQTEAPGTPSAAPEENDSEVTFHIPEIFRRQKPLGDVNPLTGEEYLTNTVRRHPQIEDYVQVYDRASHEWSDVREDYFWEFQRNKKLMMGKDYQEPIRI